MPKTVLERKAFNEDLATKDPHNNIDRHCDIIGVNAPSRSWRVVSYFEDSYGSSYWLINVETGAKMRASLASLTNLY